MKWLLPAITLSLCSVSCHETPQAVMAQVIDLTNAVCAIAPDSPPAGQPWVDLICQIVQGTEGVVSVVVNAVDGDGGPAMKVPVQSVRIRIPAGNAPAFLAAHQGKK